MRVENELFRVQTRLYGPYGLDGGVNAAKGDHVFCVWDPENNNDVGYATLFVSMEDKSKDKGKSGSISIVCSNLTLDDDLCYILEGSSLVALLNDMVVEIDLDGLQLKRQSLLPDFDVYNCIFRFMDGYVVLADMHVARLASDLGVIWSHMGCEQFWPSDGSDAIWFEGEDVCLKDFHGWLYTIDRDGQCTIVRP